MFSPASIERAASPMIGSMSDLFAAIGKQTSGYTFRIRSASKIPQNRFLPHNSASASDAPRSRTARRTGLPTYPNSAKRLAFRTCRAAIRTRLTTASASCTRSLMPIRPRRDLGLSITTAIHTDAAIRTTVWSSTTNPKRWGSTVFENGK